mgnify:FL=1
MKREEAAGPALRIEGEMTIYRAAELKEQMFGGAAPATVYDLSAVTELDTAGVQLLLLAERAPRAGGGELRLAAVSAPAAEVLGCLGLGRWQTREEAVA